MKIARKVKVSETPKKSTGLKRDYTPPLKNDLTGVGYVATGKKIKKKPEFEVSAFVTRPGLVVIACSGPMTPLLKKIQSEDALALSIAQSVVVLRDSLEKDRPARP